MRRTGPVPRCLLTGMVQSLHMDVRLPCLHLYRRQQLPEGISAMKACLSTSWILAQTLSPAKLFEIRLSSGRGT
ncbi:hypothetical protein WJX84_003227 [Apatococcus fuscideae]|uniref:Uncharacterized protein n=1 Tax=Apatococcus fuscideae TaxID=2026836 RepID=A0AAW1TBB6_9CHLO